MQLLVSVRSAAEAKVAGASGADIVDSKEPEAGPLGAVSPTVLAAILRALPDALPLGIALGDLGTIADLATALDRIPLGERAGPVFLKLGFSGVAKRDGVAALLRLAVRRAGEMGPSVMVVAAAYADHQRARSPARGEVLAAARSAGAAGVLLDTWSKDGRSLLHYVGDDELRRWVARVRGAGLLAAVAGSLGADSIPAVLAAEPDIVGVRGAACRGGRTGTLDPARVRHLRGALDQRSVPVG
jgi:uncharacterized protein (UPF0264 family)